MNIYPEFLHVLWPLMVIFMKETSNGPILNNVTLFGMKNTRSRCRRKVLEFCKVLPSFSTHKIRL